MSIRTAFDQKKLILAASLATALAYGASVVYLPNAQENGGGRRAHGGVRETGRRAVHHGTRDRIERDVEPRLVCRRAGPAVRNHGHLPLI